MYVNDQKPNPTLNTHNSQQSNFETVKTPTDKPNYKYFNNLVSDDKNVQETSNISSQTQPYGIKTLNICAETLIALRTNGGRSIQNIEKSFKHQLTEMYKLFTTGNNSDVNTLDNHSLNINNLEQNIKKFVLYALDNCHNFTLDTITSKVVQDPTLIQQKDSENYSHCAAAKLASLCNSNQTHNLIGVTFACLSFVSIKCVIPLGITIKSSTTSGESQIALTDGHIHATGFSVIVLASDNATASGNNYSTIIIRHNDNRSVNKITNDRDSTGAILKLFPEQNITLWDKNSLNDILKTGEIVQTSTWWSDIQLHHSNIK
ncbi:MAG: hypothetical protein QG673_1551 [Pseudomonadota bacterium]|nr:hypothetical protein [Pseudomonadota bacterium]